MIYIDFMVLGILCLIAAPVLAQSTDMGGIEIKPDRKFASHSGKYQSI